MTDRILSNGRQRKNYKNQLIYLLNRFEFFDAEWYLSVNKDSAEQNLTRSCILSGMALRNGGIQIPRSTPLNTQRKMSILIFIDYPGRVLSKIFKN